MKVASIAGYAHFSHGPHESSKIILRNREKIFSGYKYMVTVFSTSEHFLKLKHLK